MDRLEHLYFLWLVEQVCDDEEKERYEELLMHLYYREFEIVHELDENCAIYGVSLRDQFINNTSIGRRYSKIYEIPFRKCSILELMVSLSIEIEDEIMVNDHFGDRKSTWFWGMIENLGLKKYENDRFDAIEIDEIIDIFNRREYRCDGKGGLFSVKNASKNMRTCDVWAQAMNFLSEFALENGEIY